MQGRRTQAATLLRTTQGIEEPGLGWRGPALYCASGRVAAEVLDPALLSSR